MRKILTILAMGIASLAAGLIATEGAELSASPIVRWPAGATAGVIYPGCRYVWICTPSGCDSRHICRPRCPDRYSCYPLYGAYGPYGGTAYWGGYSVTGWGYR
jgi:hypothetical protein